MFVLNTLAKMMLRCLIVICFALISVLFSLQKEEWFWISVGFIGSHLRHHTDFWGDWDMLEGFLYLLGNVCPWKNCCHRNSEMVLLNQALVGVGGMHLCQLPQISQFIKFMTKKGHYIIPVSSAQYSASISSFCLWVASCLVNSECLLGKDPIWRNRAAWIYPFTWWFVCVIALTIYYGP